MENKSHAMAAGSFVLALLVLLGALALWLTRDRHDYTLYEMSTGDTISGLQNQATVRYKGVAVGKVTEITFDQAQQGNVLIRIAVDSKAPVSPTTTFGMLGYQGVTGIAHIQLDDMTEPMAALPEGPGGIPRLLMKSSPLSVLADQGMTILSKVDEATRRINQLLGDDNQERFSSLLLNLSDAASNVSGVTRSMHTTLQQELPGMTQDARRALQAMEKAGQEAGALAQEVRRMTTTVQGPDGALARITEGSQAMARAAERLDRATLPGISQAASDVSSAARRMGSAAAGIGDNPQSLLYGVDAGQPGPGEPGFVAPAAQ
ncbi:MlaD family protein [Comamonas aquatica]|jgi:phospholipid/cholesterol/gamma-HCH transport system substrate-binding protein|uniref:MlaD family protein n=1 Tax=Comamonas aquatica TaxID=225991 RepID=A0AA43AUT3_9BURK|nr:MlaD family protein [Comamonas aquatica]MDH0495456.1 MlaD family protein [Comamonas aquatica]MDH1426952.1 MlaD family protein [Comamonas aquatica]MDH1605758.1 MlaD family protein [Comamonas aquatica]MDH1617716.1 MlaD family protein [Comamonas aquatica]MDH1675486.1 MlaD family protein [Comamonas aquatica]